MVPLIELRNLFTSAKEELICCQVAVVAVVKSMRNMCSLRSLSVVHWTSLLRLGKIVRRCSGKVDTGRRSEEFDKAVSIDLLSAIDSRSSRSPVNLETHSCSIFPWRKMRCLFIDLITCTSRYVSST